MPKKFAVPLPREAERRKILQLILKDTKTDPEHFNLDYVSKLTAGMSGSDIKEACRDAAMAPVREYMRQHRESGRPMAPVDSSNFRGIRSDDFFGQLGGARFRNDRPARQARQPSGSSKQAQQASDDGYEDTDEPVTEL